MSTVLLLVRHAKVTINKRASGNDSIDLTVIFALFIPVFFSRITSPYSGRNELMAAPVAH